MTWEWVGPTAGLTRPGTAVRGHEAAGTPTIILVTGIPLNPDTARGCILMICKCSTVDLPRSRTVLAVYGEMETLNQYILFQRLSNLPTASTDHTPLDLVAIILSRDVFALVE